MPSIRSSLNYLRKEELIEINKKGVITKVYVNKVNMPLSRNVKDFLIRATGKSNKEVAKLLESFCNKHYQNIRKYIPDKIRYFHIMLENEGTRRETIKNITNNYITQKENNNITSDLIDKYINDYIKGCYSETLNYISVLINNYKKTNKKESNQNIKKLRQLSLKISSIQDNEEIKKTMIKELNQSIGPVKYKSIKKASKELINELENKMYKVVEKYTYDVDEIIDLVSRDINRYTLISDTSPLLDFINRYPEKVNIENITLNDDEMLYLIENHVKKETKK